MLFSDLIVTNMKTIKVGDKVWNMIVQNGKFGETADDVLGRLLSIKGSCAGSVTGGTSNSSPSEAREHSYGWKERRATVRMTQNVNNGMLTLRFDTGQTESWKLPGKDDYSAIRTVRDKAVAFVRNNGGTKGQEHAAIRALTSRGYRVTSSDRQQFI
jgi:hypothetical protein